MFRKCDQSGRRVRGACRQGTADRVSRRFTAGVRMGTTAMALIWRTNAVLRPGFGTLQGDVWRKLEARSWCFDVFIGSLKRPGPVSRMTRRNLRSDAVIAKLYTCRCIHPTSHGRQHHVSRNRLRLSHYHRVGADTSPQELGPTSHVQPRRSWHSQHSTQHRCVVRRHGEPTGRDSSRQLSPRPGSLTGCLSPQLSPTPGRCLAYTE